MTRLAIDASVVLAALLVERRPAWVDQTIDLVSHGRAALVAPTLLWVEVGNRLVRRDISDERALDAMLRVDALGITPVEMERPLRLRALQLGRDHALTMYDAMYLAVAETTGARLLTLDHRLDDAASARGLGRAGSRRISEPSAPYGEGRQPDRISLAAIGAALAEMREEYSL
jgi:predicted nucleic acid-binding protein